MTNTTEEPDVEWGNPENNFPASFPEDEYGEVGSPLDIPSPDGDRIIYGMKPSDNVFDNTLRARWAGEGLKAYGACNGVDHEPIETAIGDLLSDLMHLCDAAKDEEGEEPIDFDRVLESARRRYEEELRGEWG